MSTEQFTCDSGEACEREPTFECLCAACGDEHADERHHVCDAHFEEASERHTLSLSIAPRWYPIGFDQS